MFLTNGVLTELNPDGSEGSVTTFQPNQKTFRIGSSYASDMVLKLKGGGNGNYCEITADAFGHIFITNLGGAPMKLDGASLKKQRPLMDGNKITIGTQTFRWTCKNASKPKPSTPTGKGSEQLTSLLKAASYSAPSQKPTKRLFRRFNDFTNKKARLTVHPLSSALDDNGDYQDEEATDEVTKTSPQTPGGQCKDNEFSTPNRSLLLHRSVVLTTSYSPATPMLNTPRKPMRTPVSVYKSAMSTPQQDDEDRYISDFDISNHLGTPQRRNIACVSYVNLDSTPLFCPKRDLPKSTKKPPVGPLHRSAIKNNLRMTPKLTPRATPKLTPRATPKLTPRATPKLTPRLTPQTSRAAPSTPRSAMGPLSGRKGAPPSSLAVVTRRLCESVPANHSEQMLVETNGEDSLQSKSIADETLDTETRKEEESSGFNKEVESAEKIGNTIEESPDKSAIDASEVTCNFSPIKEITSEKSENLETESSIKMSNDAEEICNISPNQEIKSEQTEDLETELSEELSNDAATSVFNSSSEISEALLVDDSSDEVYPLSVGSATVVDTDDAAPVVKIESAQTLDSTLSMDEITILDGQCDSDGYLHSPAVEIIQINSDSLSCNTPDEALAASQEIPGLEDANVIKTPKATKSKVTEELRELSKTPVSRKSTDIQTPQKDRNSVAEPTPIPLNDDSSPAKISPQSEAITILDDTDDEDMFSSPEVRKTTSTETQTKGMETTTECNLTEMRELVKTQIRRKSVDIQECRHVFETPQRRTLPPKQTSTISGSPICSPLSTKQRLSYLNVTPTTIKEYSGDDDDELVLETEDDHDASVCFIESADGVIECVDEDNDLNDIIELDDSVDEFGKENIDPIVVKLEEDVFKAEINETPASFDANVIDSNIATGFAVSENHTANSDCVVACDDVVEINTFVDSTCDKSSIFDESKQEDADATIPETQCLIDDENFNQSEAHEMEKIPADASIVIKASETQGPFGNRESGTNKDPTFIKDDLVILNKTSEADKPLNDVAIKNKDIFTPDDNSEAFSSLESENTAATNIDTEKSIEIDASVNLPNNKSTGPSENTSIEEIQEEKITEIVSVSSDANIIIGDNTNLLEEPIQDKTKCVESESFDELQLIEPEEAIATPVETNIIETAFLVEEINENLEGSTRVLDDAPNTNVITDAFALCQQAPHTETTPRRAQRTRRPSFKVETDATPKRNRRGKTPLKQCQTPKPEESEADMQPAETIEEVIYSVERTNFADDKLPTDDVTSTEDSQTTVEFKSSEETAYEQKIIAVTSSQETTKSTKEVEVKLQAVGSEEIPWRPQRERRPSHKKETDATPKRNRRGKTPVASGDAITPKPQLFALSEAIAESVELYDESVKATQHLKTIENVFFTDNKQPRLETTTYPEMSVTQPFEVESIDDIRSTEEVHSNLVDVVDQTRETKSKTEPNDVNATTEDIKPPVVVETTEMVEPTVEAKSIEVVEPAEMIELTEVVEPAEMIELTEVVEPAAMIQLTDVVEPAEMIKLTEVVEPTNISETTEDTEVAEMEKTTVETAPTKVSEQAAIMKPTEVVEPTEMTEATEQTASAIIEPPEEFEPTEITEALAVATLMKMIEPTVEAEPTQVSEPSGITEMTKTTETITIVGPTKMTTTEQTEVAETSEMVEHTVETESSEPLEIIESREVVKLTEITEATEVAEIMDIFEPTKMTKPTEATKNAETTEMVKLTVEDESTEVSEPTNCVEISEATTRTEASVTTEMVKPTVETESIEVREPTKIIKPTEVVQPTEITEATEVAKTNEMLEPTVEAECSEVSKPAEITETTEMIKTTETTKKIEPTKMTTAEQTEVAETSEMVEHTVETESTEPFEIIESREVVKPTEITEAAAVAKIMEIIEPTVEAEYTQVVSEPADIIEPTEVVEPTKITEATKPTKKAVTTEMVKPTVEDESTEVSEPTNVVEPTEISEATTRPEAKETTETVKPTVETESTEVSEPTKVVEPTEIAEATVPTEVTEATETSNPTVEAESTEVSEPTKVVEPTEMAEAAELTEVTEMVKPSVEAESTEVSEPTKMIKPTEFVQLTEITEATEVAKTTEILEPKVESECTEVSKPEAIIETIEMAEATEPTALVEPTEVKIPTEVAVTTESTEVPHSTQMEETSIKSESVQQSEIIEPSTEVEIPTDESETAKEGTPQEESSKLNSAGETKFKKEEIKSADDIKSTEDVKQIESIMQKKNINEISKTLKANPETASISTRPKRERRPSVLTETVITPKRSRRGKTPVFVDTIEMTMPPARTAGTKEDTLTQVLPTKTDVLVNNADQESIEVENAISKQQKKKIEFEDIALTKPAPRRGRKPSIEQKEKSEIEAKPNRIRRVNNPVSVDLKQVFPAVSETIVENIELIEELDETKTSNPEPQVEKADPEVEREYHTLEKPAKPAPRRVRKPSMDTEEKANKRTRGKAPSKESDVESIEVIQTAAKPKRARRGMTPVSEVVDNENTVHESIETELSSSEKKSKSPRKSSEGTTDKQPGTSRNTPNQKDNVESSEVLNNETKPKRGRQAKDAASVKKTETSSANIIVENVQLVKESEAQTDKSGETDDPAESNQIIPVAKRGRAKRGKTPDYKEDPVDIEETKPIKKTQKQTRTKTSFIENVEEPSELTRKKVTPQKTLKKTRGKASQSKAVDVELSTTKKSEVETVVATTVAEPISSTKPVSRRGRKPLIDTEKTTEKPQKRTRGKTPLSDDIEETSATSKLQTTNEEDTNEQPKSSKPITKRGRTAAAVKTESQPPKRIRGKTPLADDIEASNNKNEDADELQEETPKASKPISKRGRKPAAVAETKESQPPKKNRRQSVDDPTVIAGPSPKIVVLPTIEKDPAKSTRGKRKATTDEPATVQKTVDVESAPAAAVKPTRSRRGQSAAPVDEVPVSLESSPKRTRRGRPAKQ